MKELKIGDTISILDKSDITKKQYYQELKITDIKREISTIMNTPMGVTRVYTNRGRYSLYDSSWQEEQQAWQWKYETEDEDDYGTITIF